MIKRFVKTIFKRLKQRLFIGRNVHYAEDLDIGRFSMIMARDGLNIGRGVKIGMNTWIACNGSIGNGVLISSYVGCVGRADHDMHQIGSAIADSESIYDLASRERNDGDAIAIEDDVWIGFSATILSGLRIGRGAVIAAGAVVVRDVQPYDVVAGNPARTVSRRFTDEQILEHEKALSLRFPLDEPKPAGQSGQ